MQTSLSLFYTFVKFKLLSNSSTSADEVLTGLLEPIKSLTGVVEKRVPSEVRLDKLSETESLRRDKGVTHHNIAPKE